MLVGDYKKFFSGDYKKFLGAKVTIKKFLSKGVYNLVSLKEKNNFPFYLGVLG